MEASRFSSTPWRHLATGWLLISCLIRSSFPLFSALIWPIALAMPVQAVVERSFSKASRSVVASGFSRMVSRLSNSRMKEQSARTLGSLSAQSSIIVSCTTTWPGLNHDSSSFRLAQGFFQVSRSHLQFFRTLLTIETISAWFLGASSPRLTAGEADEAAEAGGEADPVGPPDALAWAPGAPVAEVAGLVAPAPLEGATFVPAPGGLASVFVFPLFWLLLHESDRSTHRKVVDSRMEHLSTAPGGLIASPSRKRTPAITFFSPLATPANPRPRAWFSGVEVGRSFGGPRGGRADRSLLS